MGKKTSSVSASSQPQAQNAESLRRARPARKMKKKDILYKKNRSKKGGRPPKVTPETVKKLEAAFTNDFTMEEALDYADITRQTYYVWMKKSKEFSDKMRRAQQYPLTLAKRAVIGQLRGSAEHRPDGQLGLRFLERRQPERYRTRIEGDLTPLPNVTVILPGQQAHPRFQPKKKP